jgi:hypothetical protein
MRMWMTDPKTMCRKHLLGEHVECHMFLGHLKKKRKITKYIENNCLEPTSLKKRHDELAKEIKRRGYNHNSPLDFKKEFIDYLPYEHKNYKVDIKASLRDLVTRCKDCKKSNKYL